jgi:hypothetical protein
MTKRMYKKGLVVGIIILFISMSCLTSVSSKDISISDVEIVENNENEPDIHNVEYDYAIISGYCQSVSSKGFILWRDVYFEAGQFDKYLNIDLYKFPDIHVYDEHGLIEITTDYFILLSWPFDSYNEFRGIAFGNIEWKR